jgi:hypothetical protein
MSNDIGSPLHDDQAFWRAHHEAWQHSALNHRQYCELHGFRFGNWRAKFKAESQSPVRKLLYGRRGLGRVPTHTLIDMACGALNRLRRWHARR